MRSICRAYLWLCRRYGPGGMTLSSWAWKHAQDTGNTFYRDRIDGLFLLVAGHRNHCQAMFQRETANQRTGF
jgi:hypothetical protein